MTLWPGTVVKFWLVFFLSLTVLVIKSQIKTHVLRDSLAKRKGYRLNRRLIQLKGQ